MIIPSVQDQTLETFHSLSHVWNEQQPLLWIPEIFLCIYLYLDDVLDVIKLSRTCQASYKAFRSPYLWRVEMEKRRIKNYYSRGNHVKFQLENINIENLQIIYGYCKGLIDNKIKSIHEERIAQRKNHLNRLRILEVQQEYAFKSESIAEKIILAFAISMIISVPYTRSIMFYIGYMMHIVVTLFGSIILYVEMTDVTKYLVIAAFSLLSWKLFWFQIMDGLYPLHYIFMIGATFLASWFVKRMILQSRKELLKIKYDAEKHQIQEQLKIIDASIAERVLRLERISAKIPLENEGTSWKTVKYNVCNVM
nr:unnamed protein product [Naegleria fowleri]